MYRRGNARLAEFSLHFITRRGVKGSERRAKRLTSVFLWRTYWFGDWCLSRCVVRSCGAYETVKAGQRSLCEGRHASLSSSFSEIEFGRARPTSLLHSTIHLLIPSGEERGRGEGGRGVGGQRERERERGGMKEGRKVQRREVEK